MGKPSDRQLERHIRKVAADSSHAEVQMRRRRINKVMALEALRWGLMTRPSEPDIVHTGLKCRMERFVAGVQVAVVVYVEYPAPDLTVVTVIDVNGV